MSKKLRYATLWQAVHSTVNSFWAALAQTNRRRSSRDTRTGPGLPGINRIEPLERRVLFSGNPYILGNGAADAGEQYSLNLAANGQTFDQWEVNWGDGSSQAVPSSQTSLQHTFSQSGSDEITATALKNDGSYLL